MADSRASFEAQKIGQKTKQTRSAHIENSVFATTVREISKVTLAPKHQSEHSELVFRKKANL